MKLLLLHAFLIIWPAIVMADEYYVSPVGDDDNIGSLEYPWQSIDKANRTLVAGDTVHLCAGTYNDVINPKNDGISNTKRITYRAYGDGMVILTSFPTSYNDHQDGALPLGRKKYITVSGRKKGGDNDERLIKLDLRKFSNQYGGLGGSKGVVVENIIMEPTDNGVPGHGFTFAVNYWPENYETKYCVLRNCIIKGTILNTDSNSKYTENVVTIAKNAHHNLIENNTIEYCRQAALYADSPISSKNIIRNNKIINWHHTALSIRSAGVDIANGARFLVEGNWLEATGENPNPLGESGPGSSFQLGSDEIICRFNVLTKGGSLDQNRSGLGALMGATSTTYGAPYFATDGRFYNNSFVKNMGPAVGMYNFFELPVDLGRHKFVNNFMYGSFNDFSTHGYLTIEYWDFDFQTADRYINNVFGHPNGGPDLDFISTKRGRFNFNSALNNLSNPNDPEFSSYLGQSNIYETDPEFVDYQKNNFKLQTTSPYVDAGMSLTHVVSSDTGESKTLRVDDSRFFYGEAAEFPAWMNVQNDWIAVGASFTNSTKTQITDVNDVANVIKLKTDIRRSAGDYVWLFKDSSGREVVFGIAPDIGAYEMRSEDSNTLPIALNDSVETKESWSTSIDVLANDSDADGDLLTIVSYTQPQNGIVMESGGIFMYEPLTDYRGSDSFTYTIADGNGGQANAVVDISVDSTKASGKN